MVNETPLLLKGPLVRASLAGTKTETRRIVTRVGGIGPVTEFQRSNTPGYDWIMRDRRWLWNDFTTAELLTRCPYGQVGDRLWVRERWRTEETFNCIDGYLLAADGAFVPIADTQEAADRWLARHGNHGWRPSIFMPREACRLELTILEVRVERVQDITDAGVRAEGVADLTLEDLLEMGVSKRRIFNRLDSLGYTPKASDNGLEKLARRFLQRGALRARFRFVWDLINGHRPGCSWNDNPYLWVIQYRRVQ